MVLRHNEPSVYTENQSMRFQTFGFWFHFTVVLTIIHRVNFIKHSKRRFIIYGLGAVNNGNRYNSRKSPYFCPIFTQHII